MSRPEFLRAFKHDYMAGQHVTFLGPTQRGKTTLCFQMLKEVCNPDHRCVILAGKPPGRDHTMESAAKQLNLREIDQWPPFPTWRDKKRNGFVLRPYQSLTHPEADDENLYQHFKKAIIANYSGKEKVITVVDEGHHVQQDLKLKNVCEKVLMRGAPINSMWTLIQRGRWMSYQCYDAPEHVLIGYDPDTSNQRRYSEIGGTDPKLLQDIAANLKTYRAKTGGTISEFLYFKRSDPKGLTIVGVK